MRKKRVTRNKSKAAVLWMWEHTKMIVNCLSVLYVLNWLYSLIVIVIAIKETGQFSYLDTLISETNETFRIVVGANIVKAGVENIFKYNDFGGKGSRYVGAEKKAIVTDLLKEMLTAKNISITDEQLNILIEAAVKQMKMEENAGIVIEAVDEPITKTE